MGQAMDGIDLLDLPAGTSRQRHQGLSGCHRRNLRDAMGVASPATRCCRSPRPTTSSRSSSARTSKSPAGCAQVTPSSRRCAWANAIPTICRRGRRSPRPGEKLDHDEFMRRLLALQPVRDDEFLDALGASYLNRVRAVDDHARACSIASYEDGGLSRVFAAMLRAQHWPGRWPARLPLLPRTAHPVRHRRRGRAWMFEPAPDPRCVDPAAVVGLRHVAGAAVPRLAPEGRDDRTGSAGRRMANHGVAHGGLGVRHNSAALAEE